MSRLQVYILITDDNFAVLMAKCQKAQRHYLIKIDAKFY